MEAHVLRPEHLVQDAGEDVLAGVLLHLVKTPRPVDGLCGFGPGHRPSGQGRDHVPDDTRLLVDIGDGQHRAVGKGQGAPVGRLAAALGVEHRAVQRDAPAVRPHLVPAYFYPAGKAQHPAVIESYHLFFASSRAHIASCAAFSKVSSSG